MFPRSFCSGFNDQKKLVNLFNDFIDNQGFDKDNINNCTYTSRHYGVNHRQKQTETQHTPNIHFYKQTIDSLHFYIFHIFDSGLRTRKSPLINNDEGTKQNKGKCGNHYYQQIQIQIHLKDSEEITMQSLA